MFKTQLCFDGVIKNQSAGRYDDDEDRVCYYLSQ